MVAQGYKEAVLTGIHLSSYGIEHMEGNPVSQGDWNHRELLALIVKSMRLKAGAHPPGITGAAYYYRRVC